MATARSRDTVRWEEIDLPTIPTLLQESDYANLVRLGMDQDGWFLELSGRNMKARTGEIVFLASASHSPRFYGAFTFNQKFEPLEDE